MAFDHQTTYYEILELTPDATPQDIRNAYLRLKGAYNKDSVALYSLVSTQETEQLIRQIEEAFQVLSNPERRKIYDQKQGFLIVDVTHTPSGSSEILEAPRTDFEIPSAIETAQEPKNLDIEIQEETHWKGETLRKFREIRKLTIEEISDQTKISRTYLKAIENEQFASLPAPVFVRGFLIQISKILKLPPDKVAQAYLSRFKKEDTRKT